MGKIKSIHGGAVIGQPCPEMVSTIERMLDMARSGELSGIGYALLKKNGDKVTGWEDVEGSGDGLYVSIATLNHRYLSATLEK